MATAQTASSATNTKLKDLVTVGPDPSSTYICASSGQNGASHSRNKSKSTVADGLARPRDVYPIDGRCTRQRRLLAQVSNVYSSGLRRELRLLQGTLVSVRDKRHGSSHIRQSHLPALAGDHHRVRDLYNFVGITKKICNETSE